MNSTRTLISNFKYFTDRPYKNTIFLFAKFDFSNLDIVLSIYPCVKRWSPIFIQNNIQFKIFIQLSSLSRNFEIFEKDFWIYICHGNQWTSVHENANNGVFKVHSIFPHLLQYKLCNKKWNRKTKGVFTAKHA